jgi:hypothetical protein
MEQKSMSLSMLTVWVRMVVGWVWLVLLTCRAFSMGMLKVKINSNMVNKSKKWLPIDKLHMRQNRNLLQC